MSNCGANVCDNYSMSIFKDCPNNELLELLKTKKHARMFVHMLKYLEHKNHVLHNSLCESNSLIEKYKRRNRILCDKVDHLKKRIQSSKRIENEDDFLRSRVLISCLLVCAHLFESIQFLFMVS